MKKLFFISCIILSTAAFADIQTDMINDRLDRLDREMTLLQQKIYTVPSPSVQTEKIPENLNDLYTQLDEQNKLLTELTRKVEELTFNQETLKEEIDKLKADIDIRFTEAKKETSPLPEEKSQPDKKQASDKEAYDNAYNLLIKAKYVEAEKAFIDFLKNYPTSSLTGNANYWLGETYYVRGQYELASGTFSDGLTKYKSSTKAPDNLLKLGLTMANLNKKEDACGFFKLMPEQFPKANKTILQRAQQEAKKLSCP